MHHEKSLKSLTNMRINSRKREPGIAEPPALEPSWLGASRRSSWRTQTSTARRGQRGPLKYAHPFKSLGLISLCIPPILSVWRPTMRAYLGTTMGLSQQSRSGLIVCSSTLVFLAGRSLRHARWFKCIKISHSCVRAAVTVGWPTRPSSSAERHCCDSFGMRGDSKGTPRNVKAVLHFSAVWD